MAGYIMSPIVLTLVLSPRFAHRFSHKVKTVNRCWDYPRIVGRGYGYENTSLTLVNILCVCTASVPWLRVLQSKLHILIQLIHQYQSLPIVPRNAWSSEEAVRLI